VPVGKLADATLAVEPGKAECWGILLEQADRIIAARNGNINFQVTFMGISLIIFLTI
jgi:hypothetical protein